MTATATLFRDLPLRLRRVQVLNWGTFSDWHDIAVPDAGFLFVGHSGSGKSTLLDVFTVLLAPPGRRDFNAAARTGERAGRNDRSLLTYVRGAWSNADNEMGESARQYLRPGSTLSATALTFHDGGRRTVTLLGVFWINGSGQADADVHRLYAALDKPFDLGDLRHIKPDLRALKKHFADASATERYTAYAARCLSLLGIPDEKALRLLHKAQSAKNLGDLTEFLRQHMLDTPKSFEKKDQLLKGFGDLKECHRTVMRTRDQIAALRPVRIAWEERKAQLALRAAAKEELDALPRFLAEREKELREAEIKKLEADRERLILEKDDAAEKLAQAQAEQARWERREHDQGGAELASWRKDRDALAQTVADRERKRNEFTPHCAGLGVDTPESAEAFIRLREFAEGEKARIETENDDARERYAVLRARQKELADAKAGLARDRETLGKSKSNIPPDLLDVRDRIASAVGCPANALPFAGELMQVRPDQSGWRPALEKTLRPLALSMLVDAARYSAVIRYVNAHNLRTRLVLHHTAEAARVSRPPPRRPLFDKLEFKPHAQSAWLEREVFAHYDYHCADDIADYESSPDHADKALTREGLARTGRTRHVKDDRPEANDPRRWVLNFDTGERLALLEADLRANIAESADLDLKVKAVLSEDRPRALRAAAVAVVLEARWEDMNATALLPGLQALEKSIAAAERNPELAVIREKIAAAKKDVVKAREHHGAQLGALAVCEANLAKAGPALAKVGALLQTLSVLSDTLATRLSQRDDWRKPPAPDVVDALDARGRVVEHALRERVKTCQLNESALEADVKVKLGAFKTRWGEETVCTDFKPDASGVDGYLAFLLTLESDKIHAHETRFFEMLHQQSFEHIAKLNASLITERKDIDRRMETVNNGLAGKEFNPGTHLRIDVRNRRLDVAEDFRATLARINDRSLDFDLRDPVARARAEERFGELDKLVDRLNSPKSEDQEWSRLALDVREHVDFVAYEIDAEGCRQESYRSGDGKSGGQRQKLTAACLAAALRYQLGGEDHADPLHTTVVLDEAFANADHDFTRQSMDIFTHFGFQMIIATPFKSVRTLEPYIGAVCVVEIRNRRDSRQHVITDRAHIRAEAALGEEREA